MEMRAGLHLHGMKKAYFIFLLPLFLGTFVFAQQKMDGTYSRINGTFYPKDTNILVKWYEEGLAPFMIKGKDPFVWSTNRAGFIDTVGNIIIKPDYTNVGSFKNGYAYVQQAIGRKYKEGLIDRKGKIIIPIIYDQVKRCENGLFMIEQDGKIGFININGKVILLPDKYSAYTQPNYEYGGVGYYDNRKFSWNPLNYYPEVPFKKYIGVRAGKKWAAIDSTGKEIFPPIFDGIRMFNGSFAAVLIGKKFGVTNIKGQLVIPAQYDAIWLTGKNFAYAKTGEKIGVISLKNKVLVPVEYFNVNSFGTGFLAINKGASLLFDAKGNFVAKSTTALIVDFPVWGQQDVGFYIYNSHDKKYHVYQGILFDGEPGNRDRLIYVKRGNKWGLMDTTGKELIKPVFDEFDNRKIQNISNQGELFAFRKNNKWGILTNKGRALLPVDYDQIASYPGGLVVKRKGKWGLFTNQLLKLTSVKYDSVITIQSEYPYSVYKNYYGVKLGQKWALLNAAGKEVTLFKYDKYLGVYCGQARVQVAGKYGLVDTLGKEIAPCIYDEMNFRSDAVIIVKKAGKYGVINCKGDIVYPCIYKSFDSRGLPVEKDR